MAQEAQEEKLRQEKYIAYRLRKAEQQPTREEIAEHKRLHDEGILRLRLEKMSDERKKLVGGVNYEPDDLVKPHNRSIKCGAGSGTGANGFHDDVSEDEEATVEQRRAQGIRSVFNARANNGSKKERDWKYLDSIGTSGGGSDTMLSRASMDDSDVGAGKVYTSGYAVREGASDFNNKYHRMAVQEMRKKKKAILRQEDIKEKNLERQRCFAKNVRETFYLIHRRTGRRSPCRVVKVALVLTMTQISTMIAHNGPLNVEYVTRTTKRCSTGPK